MLQMTTKWFTNSLAKQAILSKDYIQTSDEKRLYVVGYGNVTKGGKNTYNVEIRDANDVLIKEEVNFYLDAITKLILGSSPKSKSNKENESKQGSKDLVSEFTRLENNLKKAILQFNDFCMLNKVYTLEDAKQAQSEAQSAKRKEAQNKRRSEEALLIRINKVRKWAKESKRLELFQSLNEKLLDL